MDSDEELLSFSDTEKLSSPVPERKFKRLKKASDRVSKHPPLIPSISSKLEALDSGENIGEDFEESNARSGSQLEDFKEGNDSDSGFDSLGVEEEGGSGVKRALEFDSVDEGFDGEVQDQESMEVEEEEIGDSREEDKSEKNRRNLDEFEEKKKKKKKRFKSGGDDYDENLYSAVPTKRTENKERKERLKELRAESQRLLRETRSASFTPVPLVQKPVSSILERIRQRKHEVSKGSVISNRNNFDDGNDAFSSEVTPDFDFEGAPLEDIEDHNVANADGGEKIVPPGDMENSLDSMRAEGSKNTANHSHKNVTSQTALNEESKQAFQAPVEDTQDLSFDSQTMDSKDELPDEMTNGSEEEVLAPSLHAMNLKLDSAPLEDFSSDEEDNDKENVDPRLHESVDLSSSPKGDPVKDFVDDEAEEEDDSDNDLCRFQDNEEDEDNMDSDELNDMIATGYKEKPIDNEMRNQLHQKWLEQQDAAGTENLLQRLKFGSKMRETTLLEEKGEVDEEDEEEFLDEAAEDITPKNLVRMNLKKAKEMIPQMFTDKDDVYLSSDDEEAEKRLAQQLSDKAEEQATFLSPAEYEGSKEIFGLIKKTNGVPDTRKKAKITSYFHMLSIGGNRTMSSKSSFLGRGSKNSLPSFRKHGSNPIRFFVFERDDSNSRSAISMSEDSSNLIQREKKPSKTASAKFCNSQFRSSTQDTRTGAETKSGPSLHEILRCPPLQPSHCNRDGMGSRVEAIYASFKLDQNLIKKEPHVSVRTV